MTPPRRRRRTPSMHPAAVTQVERPWLEAWSPRVATQLLDALEAREDLSDRMRASIFYMLMVKAKRGRAQVFTLESRARYRRVLATLPRPSAPRPRQPTLPLEATA